MKISKFNKLTKKLKDSEILLYNWDQTNLFEVQGVYLVNGNKIILTDDALMRGDINNTEYIKEVITRYFESEDIEEKIESIEILYEESE